MFNVIGMVVHHIEDDTDTRLVECLHHLLELTDAHLRPIRIGGVATLGHIIVHRVVAPVILVVAEACLIHRAIVITGQDMDGIHT